MATKNEEKIFNIDRKAASKLLKVSMRTLDRYAKSGKISNKVVNGRIWFEKDELVTYKKGKERVDTVDTGNMSTVDLSMDTQVDNIDNVEVLGADNVHIPKKITTRRRTSTQNKNTYQKLFIDLKKELEEKQSRLEVANYRVGQLETQLRNSVPMLEYHAESAERERKELEMKEKMNEADTFIKKIQIELKYQRFSKRLFLIVLLTILAVQPLWLLLIYK